MRRRQGELRPRKTSRRWHIPPPLVHGPEALEGGNLLQEFPGELGVVLWQALRDVMLLAATPAAERDGLFTADAERRRLAAMLSAAVDPLLEAPLRTLAAMVGDPAAGPGEAIGVACRQIGQWAEARGALETALAFAQDAALACPGDAAAALNVGRIAYKLSDHARAEIWYRRTIGLARQGRDWSLYTHAFLGLGNLYVRRGNFPAGRRYRNRALRAAKRGGLRQLQGISLHDLFILEAECGNAAEAEGYARRAMECYGVKSSRLPALANDVAYFWLINGRFSAALTVLRPLVRQMSDPKERLSVLASTARAAGGAGDREAFRHAAERVGASADDPSVQYGLARAWLDVAYGAASLEEWQEAAAAAEAALGLAERLEEAKVVFIAESILDSVRRHQALADAPPTRDEEAPAFALDFAERLEARETVGV